MQLYHLIALSLLCLSLASACPDQSRRHGTDKWFNASKGNGFITSNPDGAGIGPDELFSHKLSMEDGLETLDEGALVTFCVEQDLRV